MGRVITFQHSQPRSQTQRVPHALHSIPRLNFLFLWGIQERAVVRRHPSLLCLTPSKLPQSCSIWINNVSYVKLPIKYSDVQPFNEYSPCNKLLHRKWDLDATDFGRALRKSQITWCRSSFQQPLVNISTFQRQPPPPPPCTISNAISFHTPLSASLDYVEFSAQPVSGLR